MASDLKDAGIGHESVVTSSRYLFISCSGSEAHSLCLFCNYCAYKCKLYIGLVSDDNWLI